MVETLERRVLPAFEGIEAEAQAVADERWEEFMSAPATPDADPGDFAESAEQAGVSDYLLMNGIRQGMLNLFAAALFHTFEQQVMLFHRKQVLHPSKENAPAFFRMSEFQKRLEALGIGIRAFSSWAKVEELRLVASTVKHAEGDSARKLHQQRPDIFQPPEVPKICLIASRAARHVCMPLAGEDLYVSLKDVKEYRDAVLQFWEELADAIERGKKGT